MKLTLSLIYFNLRYEPSVFILGPGEHLHINKERLHAFRKMTYHPLPDTDCHCILRAQKVAELKALNLKAPPLCISIAYDW
jgi:hypothetical protein